MPNMFASACATFFSTFLYVSRSVLFPTKIIATLLNKPLDLISRISVLTDSKVYSLSIAKVKIKPSLLFLHTALRDIIFYWPAFECSDTGCVIEVNLENAAIEVQSCCLLPFQCQIVELCELIFCESSYDIRFAYFFRPLRQQYRTNIT